MWFLLLFFDMNNIYSFSGWWYFVAILVCDAPSLFFMGRRD